MIRLWTALYKLYGTLKNPYTSSTNRKCLVQSAVSADRKYTVQSATSAIRSGGVQLSVESNFAIALVLHCYALWLAKKSRATLSTHPKKNQNKSSLAHTRFPALGAGYMYLLRVLIGSLDCLRLFWLARIITLVLVLPHSIIKTL